MLILSVVAPVLFGAPKQKTMDESQYHQLCDNLFAEIENLLDEAGADFDINGGVIEVTLDNGGILIINRQPAAREVWLAAPNGGHHFRWNNNAWLHTRQDGEIISMLKALLA